MSDLQLNELSFFTDSLSPQQRVFLQRLLGECLSACPRAGQPSALPPGEALTLAAEALAPLHVLMEQLRQFTAEEGDRDIRPFAFTVPEPGHGLVTISRRILHWRSVWEPRAHDWLEPLRLSTLTLDLGALEDVNSAVIAWMVTLSQFLPDRRVRLRRAPLSLLRAIETLHLGHALVVDQG